MDIRKLLVITILGCIPGSVCIANTLCYAPHGTIKEQLKESVEYTQHCMDLCIHDFAALAIDEELEIARSRGVQVRVVILEYGNDNVKSSLAGALIRKGFDVRVLKPQFSDRLMQDFIVLDNRILVTGVYNWLAYRNRNICNDVIFYYDPERIHTYKNTFYRLFTEGEVTTLPANQKEWDAKNNPHVFDTVSNDKRQIMQGYLLDKESPVANQSEKPVEVISKDFVDISFEEMDKQFGKQSKLSRSEKNELWKKYKGEYVRWRGVVSYKGMGRVDWNRIGVSHRKNNKNANVEILFDWKMFEKVMDIKVGSTITYTGRLVSRSGINAPYRLDDGDIE